MNESSDEGKGCQSGGSDGEAFADGGGGVSDDVEGVSDLAGLVTHFGHFGDAACVVRNGAISIDGHGDSNGAEHANGGKAHSIEFSAFVSSIESGGDGQDWEDHGLKAHRKSADNKSGNSGFTLGGDGADWLSSGVVFSDEPD